jgi:hypothetical protein
MPNQSVPTRHKIESILFISSLSAFTLRQRVSELVEGDPKLNNCFLVSDDKFDKFSIAGLDQVGEIRFILDGSSIKESLELNGVDPGTQFLILEYRVGDKHLVTSLLQKLKRYLTKFPLPKSQDPEEPENLKNIPMFFLSLRTFLASDFIISDSAIESARSCVSFDDVATVLMELETLSNMPRLLNGEDNDVFDFDEHAKASSHMLFYQNQKFKMKQILHFGKKHILDHRFIIHSEKGNTRLLLHVKWLPKARKHLIGFIEELPSAK